MKFTSVVALLALWPALLWAGPTDEAQQLADEAMQILKENAARNATPEQYASAIFKLEKAQALIEKSSQAESPQAQEVNTALFWARRFSNTEVIAALDKLRGGASMPPPPKPSVPKKSPPPEKDKEKEKDKVEGFKELTSQPEAKAAFEAAEKYAQTKAGDPYAVALRWFYVASQYSGTEYAIRALQLARAAQEQHVSKLAPSGTAEGELPDTPEMSLVKEADGLAKGGKFELAIEAYKKSIRVKDNIPAQRRLGHVYFKRAQQLKDEVMPKLEALQPVYQRAWQGAWQTRTLGGMAIKEFNEQYPPWMDAKRKYDDLKKQANNAMMQYLYAQWAFETVLKLSPENRDLDAAAHAAISLSVRNDAKYRARQLLEKVLKDYFPGNDVERAVYEFCRTELERLKG